jgi:hypothetical protein
MRELPLPSAPFTTAARPAESSALLDDSLQCNKRPVFNDVCMQTPRSRSQAPVTSLQGAS